MNLSEITFPLDPNESAALYRRLSKMGARTIFPQGDDRFDSLVDEEILAVAAEESRFDYRLLYILVALLAERLTDFHPFRLRAAGQEMKTRAVWGVVFEFAEKIRADTDLTDFASIVLRDVQPAPAQLYWNNLRRPRPERMLEIVKHAPEEFRRWGLYSNELPFLKELEPIARSKTYSPETRRSILRQLLRTKKEISMSDYLQALDHAVTRQQAHKDLISFPRLKPISDRRGRRYRHNSPAKKVS